MFCLCVVRVILRIYNTYAMCLPSISRVVFTAVANCFLWEVQMTLYVMQIKVTFQRDAVMEVMLAHTTDPFFSISFSSRNPNTLQKLLRNPCLPTVSQI